MKDTPIKPLSEKPLGYVLATAGGVLGGPIGIIISPLVLFALSKIMHTKNDKVPNRFLVWAAFGIIGVPLSIIPLVGVSELTSGRQPASQTTKTRPWETVESDALVAIGRVANAAIDVGRSASPGSDLKDLLTQSCDTAMRVRDEALSHPERPIETTDNDTVLALNGVLRQCGVLADRHNWREVPRES
jgi:hypothetical protein